MDVDKIIKQQEQKESIEGCSDTAVLDILDTMQGCYESIVEELNKPHGYAGTDKEALYDAIHTGVWQLVSNFFSPDVSEAAIVGTFYSFNQKQITALTFLCQKKCFVQAFQEWVVKNRAEDAEHVSREELNDFLQNYNAI